MKRFVVVLAIILVSAKLITVTDIVLQKPAKAIAQTENPSLREDMVSPDRALLYSLQKRQTELNQKEEALKVDEQRLAALRKEISDKIETLKQIEAKLNATLDAEKGADGKRYKDLAKVYEAMPPAKAGVMLAKLDVKTAAGITIHMKRDRAGAIWGHLEPQKAVDITNEITRQGGLPVVE
jgi:flagellar motility protein MotE (MotC chaperone)